MSRFGELKWGALELNLSSESHRLYISLLWWLCFLHNIISGDEDIALENMWLFWQHQTVIIILHWVKEHVKIEVCVCCLIELDDKVDILLQPIFILSLLKGLELLEDAWFWESDRARPLQEKFKELCTVEADDFLLVPRHSSIHHI